MRFLFYSHSLVSDWNHGNAHFLRGVMRELLSRGHAATALEPDGGWSRDNLRREHGDAGEMAFARTFPELVSDCYGPDFPHEGALDQADVVVVHEWTEPELVARIGRARMEGGRFTLLFHDTHHRAVSDEAGIAGLDLAGYDAVLCFGETLSERYRKRGWGRRVFTWHEAADTSLFRPQPAPEHRRDLVWIGNWGDGERTRELDAFLLEPARLLRLSGTVHGVRYPAEALERVSAAGLDYAGWLPNARVPAVFAQHRVTVHVPRRPYVERLPGIPTIRVFEALACGIPLVSAPWTDAEGLLRVGRDFLMAPDADAMTAALRDLLADPARAREQAAQGLATILTRHTCRHRVDELLLILSGLGASQREEQPEREAMP
ncbi:CgeB family protein [Alsobacter sp. R-9]